VSSGLCQKSLGSGGEFRRSRFLSTMLALEQSASLTPSGDIGQ
jgi:hypothetical protein